MASILVTDDDRSIRLLVRSILTGAGHSVEEAANGAEALEKIRAQYFDLAVLDIWMPEMTGLELLAQLQSEARSPKVVMLTSDDAPESLLRAARDQAYRYIKKPVERQELLGAVATVLAAKTGLPPIEVVSAQPDWIELLVPCDLEAAERIHTFLEHLQTGLAKSERDKLAQAFRELLLNAVEWGGKLNVSRQVRISYIRAKRMVLYRIADPGHGFQINQLPHAAISFPEDQPMEHLKAREAKGIRPGGFGLLMARTMVDELIYNEKHNEVVLVKYLD
ncbi:MAG: response regulator [Acidobacteria bacterium]|nr:response regulator [Acidobacteriota bacterium]